MIYAQFQRNLPSGSCPLGHYKNDFFGAALGFPHYLVHLMPIGTILSKIDQYLDLPHQF